MDSNSSSITRYMGLAQNAMNKSQERLASGSRINRAVDDAAGLAVAAALDATAATLSVATNNASYGQSMASIADSAMGVVAVADHHHLVPARLLDLHPEGEGGMRQQLLPGQLRVHGLRVLSGANQQVPPGFVQAPRRP